MKTCKGVQVFVSHGFDDRLSLNFHKFVIPYGSNIARKIVRDNKASTLCACFKKAQITYIVSLNCTVIVNF